MADEIIKEELVGEPLQPCCGEMELDVKTLDDDRCIREGESFEEFLVRVQSLLAKGESKKFKEANGL